MHKHATANRSFRLVWSAARGAYVVAPETASGRSKSSASGGGQASRLATAVAFAAGVAWCGGIGFDAAAQVLPAPTTVVPTGGNTRAYTNPNGVSVVNIATANAAGLSNNLYTKYNVDASGLVLNNIANASGGRSHLAGQVQGNLNLNAPARVILNQVVAPNRSFLAGFTEVLGNKADVIVANPYGITCSGCGFLNTDRVTLTTGLPTIAADGSLTGFAVTGGDILVNGTGLNASAQQILDLVTRSVRLDGQVNAATTGVIGVTTGNNQWNYGSRTVTGSTAGSGAAPSFAVDSTALGGMYAGRIQLIATEAGVGVRMLGEVAASTDDFTLSSAGKIDLRSKIAAQRDVTVVTSSAGADAINLANAQLSATRNLQLQAAAGGATINGGVLVAGGSLGLALATLSDIQSGAAITDNNKRFGDTVSITTTGAAALDGVSWGAAKALNANMGSLNVGASGATLSGGTTTALATTGDMNLGKATVWSSGDMSLTAATGAIRTTAGGQGVESKTGKLEITAGNGLDNDGAIAASNGAMTVKVNGTLDNSGTLYSKSNMAISDKAGAATENIVNSGILLADGTLNVKAAQVTNSGDLQGTGGSTLTADSLNNSGKFIASSAGGTSATLNLATLSNSGAGTVQSNQDLVLNVSSSLTNAGNIIAGRNLGITSTGSGLALTNQSGGTLQAGAAVGSTLSVAGPAVTLNNNAGAKMLGDKFTVAAAAVTNAGALQGGTGASTLAVAGTLTNSGTVTLATSGAGSGTVSANQIANSGTIQSAGAATLSAATALNNTVTGKIMANQLALTAATLANAGVLQGGAGAGTINVTNTLTNAGSGTLTLSTDGAGSGTITANAITNDGTLQSTGAATLNVAGAVNNNASGKIMADRLTTNSASLSNAGVLQGGTGASTLNVTNTLTNSGTLTLATTSAGSGTVNASQVTNSGTLQSLGSAALNVATGVSNTTAGKILAGTGLTVRGTDAAYAVDNQGTMQSGGALDVKGQGSGAGVTIGIGGSGKMLGQTVALNTQNLAIANGGSLGSTGNMTVMANTLTLGGTAAKIVGSTAGGNTTITSASAFSNPGAIHSGGNLVFNAPSVTNTATGGMSALGNLTVNALGGSIYNAGALYAGGTFAASAASGTVTNAGTLAAAQGTMDAGLDIKVTAGTFVNNSTVRAGRNMDISATTFKNEVLGGDTRSWVEVSRTAPVKYDDQSWYSFPDSYATEYWKETWRMEQQYANNVAPAFTPQIIGGNAITIKNFTSGKNLGSSISAPTVTLTGTGTFTNDSLSLGFREMRKTWEYYTHYIALGPATYQHRTYRNASGDQQTGAGVVSARPGGIYASNLNAAGFSLATRGLQFGATPVVQSATAPTGTALTATTTLAGATTAVINVAPVGTATSVAFGGILIQLPTNPNGYFVMGTGGSATYLVETNPLFANVTNLYGSAYLAQQFGLTPDQLTKRLGDANYEAYLIRQQLIAQTGRNLLAGYEHESNLLQSMMANGAVEAQRLGFTWGVAPTNDVLANLAHDVVWMVKVNVGGQEVLTPVVYLSQATIAGITSGTVIEAKNINMTDMVSVTNEGGTIIGSESLRISADGDIKNLSGTIKGGTVALTSTAGSITSETQTRLDCSDDAAFCNTVIGKTAGIEATGNLTLDANQDIKLTGASMKAGGDASLTAGKDILIETIVNKTRTTDHTGLSGDITPDTTRDYSQANYDGAKRFNEGAIALTVADNRDISRSGADSVMNSTTTIKRETETNTGSLIDAGLSLTMTAKNGKITVKGSELKANGDLALEAKSVDVLAVEDKDTTTTTSTRYSFGIFADGKSVSSVEAGASSVIGNEKADATYKTENDGAVTIGTRIETNTTVDQSITNRGSRISSGGNLTIKATDTAKFVGAQVTAGSNLTIEAADITNEAAIDKTTSVTTWSQDTQGLSFDLKADSQAYARARVTAVGTVGAGVKALGDAKAEVGVGVRVNQRSGVIDTGNTYVVGNEFTAGGDFTRTAATGTIKDEATQVTAGGNITQTARVIEDISVSDTAWKNTSETNKDYRAGLYVGGWAEGIVGGQVGMGGKGVNKGVYTPPFGPANKGSAASVEPTVDATVGLRVTTIETTKAKDSSIAVANVSKFSAGGNINSTSTEKTTLVGASLEAKGGDVTITAGEFEFKAAENKTTRDSTFTELKNEGRAGITATVSVKDMAADAQMGVMAETIHGYEKLAINQQKSKAVAGSIASAGSVNITTTGATDKGNVRLEGTTIEAGTDVSVKSTNGDLVLDAAKDTETKNGLGGVVLDKNRAKTTGGLDTATLFTFAGSYGLEVTTGHNQQDYEKITGKGVNITSKTGNVALDAGKSITTQGAAIEATAGNVDLTAKTGITLGEALTTESLETSGHASFSTAGVAVRPKAPITGSAATGWTLLATGTVDKSGSATTITSGTDKKTTLDSTAGEITWQTASIVGAIDAKQPIAITALTDESSAHALSIDYNQVSAFGVPTLSTRISEAPRVVDQNVSELKNRMQVDELEVTAVDRAPRTALVAPSPVPSTAAPTPVATPTAPMPTSVPPGLSASVPPAVNTAMPVFAPIAAHVPKTAPVAVQTRETPETRVQAPKPGVAPKVKVTVIKPVIKASQVKVPPRAPRNPRSRVLKAIGAGQATTAAPATLAPVSANQQAVPVTVSANAAPQ